MDCFNIFLFFLLSFFNYKFIKRPAPEQRKGGDLELALGQRKRDLDLQIRHNGCAYSNWGMLVAWPFLKLCINGV